MRANCSNGGGSSVSKLQNLLGHRRDALSEAAVFFAAHWDWYFH
jgi:hypothetical protein